MTEISGPAESAARLVALRRKAVELEGVFLSEMLAAAGMDRAAETAGGGQFASFLRGEQAQAMAQQGGIGLAEALFRAMLRAERPDV
ncbi:MAG: hypothetical protein A2092_10770 [Rhodobacteraceae bacterium GWE1_64_9]|nr:MAG: hypothetical protein A2092_10770 [Rhodobacteraceae bacterium GWE1_64_9]OHC50928.1 MAG: hypothetical protein A2X69_14285 [Rhodobacteraceae bacterium GWF1_65_7]HBD90475.1 hypothetical protein [Gemmobacter sp.]HBU15345.1 hypothetical protein [Gemmobacter sp.]